MSRRTERLGATLVPILILSVAPATVAGAADTSAIDQTRRAAVALERARDCEGAYKKYAELVQQAQLMANKRRRRSLLAFSATKMAVLKPCYEKCTPTPTEKDFLDRARRYHEQGQHRRADRVLRRVLRGKNPRCTSWKEALALRATIRPHLPRRRRSTKVDPCDLSDATKQELDRLRKEVAGLRRQIDRLGKPAPIPPPPSPPSWARKGRRYRRWLGRWQRRQRWLQRRRFRHRIAKDLRRILELHRTISKLRERFVELREELQDCDQTYKELKGSSVALRQLHDQAGGKVVGLYERRLKTVTRKMRWFARQYWKRRKAKKLEEQTISQLRNALARQQRFIGEVAEDLESLTTLLVFKLDSRKEGRVAGDGLLGFQQLLADHQRVLKLVRSRHPSYFRSIEGRASLRRHISSLDRLGRVMERFANQGTGKRADRAGVLLKRIRATSLLLSKAEKVADAEAAARARAGKPEVTLAASKPKPAPGGGGGFGLGWILIGLAVVAGAVAVVLLSRGRRVR